MINILVNKCFGGYSLSEEAAEATRHIADRYELESLSYRTNPEILRVFDVMGSEEFSGYASKIKKVSIPDTATDWIINEYDGLETVIYVVNGKIHTT
jgi:hypothetical protein